MEVHSQLTKFNIFKIDHLKKIVFLAFVVDGVMLAQWIMFIDSSSLFTDVFILHDVLCVFGFMYLCLSDCLANYFLDLIGIDGYLVVCLSGFKLLVLKAFSSSGLKQLS